MSQCDNRRCSAALGTLLPFYVFSMTAPLPQSSHSSFILLVDDEPDLRKLFVLNFEQAGFEVLAVGTAALALAAAKERRPDVVVLDLMLPDLSGTEVCRRLRADPELGDVAVIMLTARGDEYDRLLGFEVGADDYVVKPFSVRELVLRVRALTRRLGERTSARQRGGAGQRYAWKGLELQAGHHRVYLDGEEVPLRPLEYKLLLTLLEQPARTFSRRDLLEEVWETSGDIHTRTVDTHVRRLRERLGAFGDLVETVHSVGYRLRQP